MKRSSIMTITFVAAVAGLVPLLAACPGLAPPGPSGGGSAGGTVIGSGGGTSHSADGLAVLDVPAGALAADVTVTFAPTAKPLYGSVAAAFDIGPTGTTFQKDATLTLGYDPAQLPAGVTAPQLAVAEDVNGSWVMLPTSAGAAPNTLSAPVRGLGSFAVVYAGYLLSPAVTNVYLARAGAHAEGHVDANPGYLVDDPASIPGTVYGSCSLYQQGLPIFPASAVATFDAAGHYGPIPGQNGTVYQSEAEHAIDLAASPTVASVHSTTYAQTRTQNVTTTSVASAGTFLTYVVNLRDPSSKPFDLVLDWGSSGTGSGNVTGGSGNAGTGITVTVYRSLGSGTCNQIVGSGPVFSSSTLDWTDGSSVTYSIPAVQYAGDSSVWVYVDVSESAGAQSVNPGGTLAPAGAQTDTSVKLTVVPK